MDEIRHKKGKIYYSMGELSEMFDVNPSLIRFWEKKFDLLKPHKNKKGNRMFTPEDVDNLKLIYHLVKEKGMTLAGAQKQLKTDKLRLQRNLEVIDRLLSIKSTLLEIKQELRRDGGEAYYDEGELGETGESLNGNPIERNEIQYSGTGTTVPPTEFISDSGKNITGSEGTLSEIPEPRTTAPFHQPALWPEEDVYADQPVGEANEITATGQKVSEHYHPDETAINSDDDNKLPPGIYEQTLF